MGSRARDPGRARASPPAARARRRCRPSGRVPAHDGRAENCCAHQRWPQRGRFARASARRGLVGVLRTVTGAVPARPGRRGRPRSAAGCAAGLWHRRRRRAWSRDRGARIRPSSTGAGRGARGARPRARTCRVPPRARWSRRRDRATLSHLAIIAPRVRRPDRGRRPRRAPAVSARDAASGRRGYRRVDDHGRERFAGCRFRQAQPPVTPPRDQRL